MTARASARTANLAKTAAIARASLELAMACDEYETAPREPSTPNYSARNDFGLSYGPIRP